MEGDERFFVVFVERRAGADHLAASGVRLIRLGDLWCVRETV